MRTGRPTITDDAIRARLLAVYSSAATSGLRPPRPAIQSATRADWVRVRPIRDAMVAAGELPDLPADRGAGTTGQRFRKGARRVPAAPVVPAPAIERGRPAAPSRVAARPADRPPDPGRYRRPGWVGAALAVDRGLRAYGAALSRRIAEKEASP